MAFKWGLGLAKKINRWRKAVKGAKKNGKREEQGKRLGNGNRIIKKAAKKAFQ